MTLLETTAKLNVELQGVKRASCRKTYVLPFKLQEGDHIKLNGQDVSNVEHIYVDLETEEITAILKPILFEKYNKEAYEETINLLKNLGWTVKER